MRNILIEVGAVSRNNCHTNDGRKIFNALKSDLAEKFSIGNMIILAFLQKIIALLQFIYSNLECELTHLRKFVFKLANVEKDNNWHFQINVLKEHKTPYYSYEDKLAFHALIAAYVERVSLFGINLSKDEKYPNEEYDMIYSSVHNNIWELMETAVRNDHTMKKHFGFVFDMTDPISDCKDKTDNQIMLAILNIVKSAVDLVMFSGDTSFDDYIQTLALPFTEHAISEYRKAIQKH
jgi:hypothetical protein